MKDIKSEFSPQLYARAGGVAYLTIIVAGFLAEMVIRNRLIVSGDPAATAHNILTQPLLWRMAIACDLLMHICDAVVSIVYYILLKPVNKNLVLMSLFLGLVQTAVRLSCCHRSSENCPCAFGCFSGASTSSNGKNTPALKSCVWNRCQLNVLALPQKTRLPETPYPVMELSLLFVLHSK